MAALKPLASRDSGTSAGKAGDRLPELERFDIPLGARPSGRFLRLSGERPGAELVREMPFLLRSSARSARFCCSSGCTLALSGATVVLSGDLGGDAGFEGEAARDTVLDRGSALNGSFSCSSLDVSLVFRGDRFGDTSCRGC